MNHITIVGSDAEPWGNHIRAEQEIQRLDGIASNEITSTRQEVETIASKYGAHMP
jgi:hypothetical protein